MKMYAKSLYKKVEAKWALPLVVASVVIAFQNCGGEFQPLDEFKYGSEYARNIVEQTELQSYWDNLYDYDILMAKNEIIFDSTVNSSATLFFADTTTSFFVVTNRRSGSELSLVVDRDQILKVVVQGNSVKLIHEAPASNFSEVSFAIDPNQPLVIGARAGKDPRNILLMVNGEYRTLTVKQTGTPLNFNYLESSLSLTNIQETLIFKRAMEPGEINVISRQIASQYNIPTKTSNTMPDYLAWSNESALFPQVRTIMRNSCFRCHTSWISLSESGFTTASSYTKNIQLVKPKSLEESPLWHSLKGSVDNNPSAKRDMPKDLPGLSAEQIDTIKSWIYAISN
ncbi:MAG: hypothetical protein JNM24_01475 [Bdellovibrionaceae bacterium]|nr:hypothetical protein [Pseudobdellovibrionaceae bacterium]